jgi:hypothetical protein
VSRAPAVLLACVLVACSNGDAPAAELDAGADGFALGPPGDELPADASLGTRARFRLRSCAGGPESFCHAAAAGNLVLPGDGTNLVDIPSTERPELYRVAPGDPARSYLYLKVLGDGGIEGGSMPLGGPADPKLAALLADWIEAGAP